MDDDLREAANANEKTAGFPNPQAKLAESQTASPALGLPSRPPNPTIAPPSERKPGLALSDRHAIILALILAIAGILLLFYLGNMGEPKLVPVNELSRQPDNARVTFSGTVEQVTVKDTSTSLRVCDADGTCVSASVLHSQVPFLFRAGDSVTVTGRVNSYYDKKLVRADKVELN